MSIDAESSTCSKCGRRGCWTVTIVADDIEGQPVVWFKEFTCRCGHTVSEETDPLESKPPTFAGGMGAP
jgi:hypothetical protein